MKNPLVSMGILTLEALKYFCINYGDHLNTYVMGIRSLEIV